MSKFFKHSLVVINLVVLGLLIYLHTEESRIDDRVSRRILKNSEVSYFIGCASATGAFEYCQELALQYRDSVAKNSGMTND